MFKDYFSALLHEKPCHFLLTVRAYVQGMERVTRSENMLYIIYKWLRGYFFINTDLLAFYNEWLSPISYATHYLTIRL